MLDDLNTDAVVAQLHEYWDVVNPAALLAEGTAEEMELVTNDAFAFLLACSLDRQTPIERIWPIPYYLKGRLGHLDPCKISSLSPDYVLQLLKESARKPRYMNAAVETILDFSRLVCERYAGVAERLYNHASALEFKHEFMSVRGVGPGIANMAAILLLRLKKVEFKDLHRIDVKPDVHVQRVMYRLGLIEHKNEKAALIRTTQLSPDFPGKLDSPLWHIGRTFCRAALPICPDCPMTSVCLRQGL